MRTGGLAQGGQVGDPAVGGLGGADRDQGGVRADRLGEPLQRDRPHLEVPAHMERVQHGGEVVLGGEHFGARGQRGGDQSALGGDGRTGRDPGHRHAGQPGERGPGDLDVVEERIQRPALGPDRHRLVQCCV